MAVSVEYQAWLSADYNWLDKTTSTAAPQQINDKLTAWITAVNANAANTNKQLTLRKGPADSTSTNFIGWVLELGSASSGAPFYFSFYTYNSTLVVSASHLTWANDESNGGYGGRGSPNSTNYGGFYTSGQNAEFAVATETANGQEFFCLGWRTTGNATQEAIYSGAALLFKDSNGEWASYHFNEYTHAGSFYMPTNTTLKRQFEVRPLVIYGNGITLDPLVLTMNSQAYMPSAGNAVTLAVSAANPNLLTGEYGSFGRYCALPASTTAVSIGFSPIFVRY